MRLYIYTHSVFLCFIITCSLTGCGGLVDPDTVDCSNQSAKAVVRYVHQANGKDAEYIYVAAGHVLRYYRVERAISDSEPDPTVSLPVAMKDIYHFPDEIQHMDVDRGFLFLNAGGDGFYIFDLSANPLKPKEVYSGFLPDSDCDINDLDVNNGLVAVSCENSEEPPLPVDAQIYKFTAQTGKLDLKYDALSSVTRMTVNIHRDTNPDDECQTKYPISVAMSADNAGFYVGYYQVCETDILTSSLAETGGITYIPFNCDINTEECNPSPDVNTFLLGKYTGAPWDMAVRGNDIYAATYYGNHQTVLSRFFAIDNNPYPILAETTLLDLKDLTAAGKSIHIHNNLLIIATEGERHYVSEKPASVNPANIWLFEWPDDLTAIPTLVASASIPNAVTDVNCRDAETASDREVYVTDDQGKLYLLRWNGEVDHLDIAE